MSQYHKEFTIFDLLKHVFRKAWLIVIFMIVFGSIAFYLSAYEIPNLYESEVTIFIGKESGALAEFNFLDLQIGAQLIVDYKELIKTKTVREEVVKKRNSNIDPKSLLKRVSVRTVKDSRFMVIVVVDKDPYVASFLANAFAEVLIIKAEDVIGAKNIQVVDAAVPVFEPVSPNVLSSTVMFIFLGGLFGIIIRIVIVLSDTKVNSRKDIEELVSVPFLGQLLPIKSNDLDEGMVMLNNTNAYDAELYKLIRTNLDFMSVDKQYKKFMFTSAHPSEGKTTTIANIAVAFAQIGKKVLLIDADLRKPRIHKLFRISNYIGLTNIIVENQDVAKVIKQTKVKNLYVIPSGPKPPNPNEILMSNKMEALIKNISNSFDLVLIDSPPVLSVADSLTLSRCIDGIVLIVANKQTKKEDMVLSVRNIEKVNTPIVGIALTKVKVKKKEYYYYE